MSLRQRAKVYRATELERVRREIESWWVALRAKWLERRQAIVLLGLQKVDRAKRIERHERERARELAGHRRKVAATWAEHRKREAASESDDEVTANLEAHHPELVPVFREIRKAIKPKPRMTRTEVMLQWAHDHSGEVLARTVAQEDRELARAIQEHEAAEREAYRHQARPGPKVRKTRGTPARRLATGVPF